MGETNLVDPGVSSLLHPHLVKEGRGAPIFLLAMRTAPRICVQRVRIHVRVRKREGWKGEKKRENEKCVCREGKVEMQYTKMDRGNKMKSQGKRMVGQEKVVVLGRVGPQPI